MKELKVFITTDGQTFYNIDSAVNHQNVIDHYTGNLGYIKHVVIKKWNNGDSLVYSGYLLKEVYPEVVIDRFLGRVKAPMYHDISLAAVEYFVEQAMEVQEND